MKHTVDIDIQDPRWHKARLDTAASQAIAAALDHLGCDPSEVAILACDDARIATLNADFRNRPTPTNVLSWPAQDRAPVQDGATPSPPEGPELGDIAIAYDTCAREAADACKSLHDHATHLIVHGLLHLLGYDHIRDGDATVMERLEIEILGKMGLDDPYLHAKADPSA